MIVGIGSPPLEHCRSPLDEGLNALSCVSALEHTISDRGNAGYGGRLTVLGVFRGSLLGHLDPERSVARNDRREFHGASDLLANRHDFLNETDFAGPLRVEFIAQEEMIHHVAPARTGKVPEVSAAQRGDATLRFHLAEPAVVGGNHDIARQHQLDTHRVNNPLSGCYYRLPAALAEAENVDIAFLDVPFFRVWSEELRHVEMRLEMRQQWRLHVEGKQIFRSLKAPARS
jgi:hypothetical protein